MIAAAMADKVEQFKKFIEQYPDQPFARYALAMELRKAQRYDESLAAFQDLSERAPDYVATYLMAGQTAEQAGKPDVARTWYQRGLEAAGKKGDGKALGELQDALGALG